LATGDLVRCRIPAKILPIGSLVFPDAYVEGGALGICKTPASQSGLKAIVVGRYMEYPEGVFDGAVVIVHAVAWPVTTSDQLLAPVELAIVNSRGGSEFDTVAIDVNSSLQVVGTIASETSIYKHAYRWQLSWDSTRQQLSSDSGNMLFPTRQWSSALAINESGDICGERAGNARPFLLKRSGSGYVDQALVVAPGTQERILFAAHSQSSERKLHATGHRKFHRVYIARRLCAVHGCDVAGEQRMGSGEGHPHLGYRNGLHDLHQ
jgi:hypothetical protein